MKNYRIVARAIWHRICGIESWRVVYSDGRESHRLRWDDADNLRRVFEPEAVGVRFDPYRCKFRGDSSDRLVNTAIAVIAIVVLFHTLAFIVAGYLVFVEKSA